MSDAVLGAAATMLARDALRCHPPALADGCDHDMQPLPIIDMRIDMACTKCGGWKS